MAKLKYQEPKGVFWRLYSWVDERLGLSEIDEFLRKKPVPAHKHSFWYYWGGLALFFFLIQIITGILLLFYYKPGPEAYESVRQITYEFEFGWLVRSLHHWSANLMVLGVFAHMFSVFFMRAYRKPREFGWWTGLAMGGMTLLFAFSGYLLPFDELSYFATKIGLDIPEVVPAIGPWLSSLVRGGTDVTEITIQRFFALHVVILPLIMLAVLAVHLWLVQKHGVSSPPSVLKIPKSKRKYIPYVPDYLYKETGAWFVALAVLIFLASLFPPQLGSPADPLAPAPEGIHPEWYFMSPFFLLKLFGYVVSGVAGEIFSILFLGFAVLIWAAVPLYDVDGSIGVRARIAAWLGIVGLAGLIVTTVLAYTTNL